MEAFINEKSLHAQFGGHSIEAQVVEFIKLLNLINEIEPKFVTLKSVELFQCQAIPGTHFDSSLNSNVSLRQLFFQNIKNTSNWNEQQIHETNSAYIHDALSYTGFSIAEIAERKLQSADHIAVILNFSNSIFGEKEVIDVTKDAQNSTDVNCAFSAESLRKWLEDNGLIDSTIPYNNSFKRAPFDHETVLNNGAFELTNYKKNKGRRVFRKIGTSELWTVDRKHTGDGAHIEVFSETTAKHLGTSKYNQVNLETKYVRPQRIIDLS